MTTIQLGPVVLTLQGNAQNAQSIDSAFTATNSGTAPYLLLVASNAQQGTREAIVYRLPKGASVNVPAPAQGDTWAVAAVPAQAVQRFADWGAFLAGVGTVAIGGAAAFGLWEAAKHLHKHVTRRRRR